MSHNDTIVARQPSGTRGVGILRISGLKARDVAQAVLGKLPKPRYADYLPFNDVDGTPLDQGLRCGSRAELLYREDVRAAGPRRPGHSRPAA